MISTTIRGRYEGGVREAVTTVTVHGGAVKLNGNVTEATFVNGSSLEGLSFSLEKPGSFLIDFDVPKQDVRFQFMNNMRVMEKPLNFTYTHWRGDNRTVVDGTLAIDSSNKLSANYGFDSGNCKLGYSYVHKGLTTFEPSYDFAKNSWDVALSQRVDEDNVVKASYQSSSKVLGLEWCKSPISSGGFKEPSHDFPLDECKGINGPLTSFLDMLTYTSYPNQPSLQESSEVHPNFASLVTQLPTLTPDGCFHLSRPSLVKISASVNLAEESKFPTLSVDSRLHVEL